MVTLFRVCLLVLRGIEKEVIYSREYGCTVQYF